MNLISLKKWDARIKSDLDVINYLWEKQSISAMEKSIFLPLPPSQAMEMRVALK
jgi:hypothetical protein